MRKQNGGGGRGEEEAEEQYKTLVDTLYLYLISSDVGMIEVCKSFC